MPSQRGVYSCGAPTLSNTSVKVYRTLKDVCDRESRKESTAAVLGAEDQLSAKNTPEISRAASRSSVQTRASAYTSASTYTTSTASAIPRRVMLNGTLFFDHRFDDSGAAVKGEDGEFRTSPFNSIRKLRRTPTEEKEMMAIIRFVLPAPRALASWHLACPPRHWNCDLSQSAHDRAPCLDRGGRPKAPCNTGRMCAEYQGGSGRKTDKNPEYYPQPLSPTSRFDPPVRMPEKRLPLGVYPP